jgi:hypothetical protein
LILDLSGRKAPFVCHVVIGFPRGQHGFEELETFSETLFSEMSHGACTQGSYFSVQETIPMRLSILVNRASFFGALLGITFSPVLATAASFTGPMKVNFVASTVPANGDVNPYGVAVVPVTTGKLVAGHVLISNFNNIKNLQGTGTTIMDIAPDGTVRVFARISAAGLPGSCPGGVGLTTALVALRTGWVIVGSLPTKDGTAATAKAGCLLVVNKNGHVVETFSGSMNGVTIDGPWDMTAFDGGELVELFVSNVLNGTVAANGKVARRGTVIRIILVIDDGSEPVEVLRTVIGSGFPEKTDPAALVIGPTGLGLAEDGTLYVADTLGNRVAAIHNAVARLTSAGAGITISSNGGLNGPLGLAIAPNGDILTVNAGDGNLIEITPKGSQFPAKMIDTSGAGAGTLFGLAVTPQQNGVFFVDDGDNTLDLLH